MKKISTITTDGGQNIIDFTNIPQIYTDLIFVASIRNSSASSQEVYVTVNGSGGSGTAITNRYLIGSGSSVATAVTSSAAAIWQVLFQNGQQTANTFGNLQLHVPNYSNSTRAKVFAIESVSENYGTSAEQRMMVSGISTTAAITSMQFISASNNFTSGSTITLYGLTNS